MNIPENLLYSKEHEWLSREGEVVTIGVSDFAQKELGDVVFVELPEVGHSLSAQDAFGSLESVKAVSEAFTPVGGEVTEVNESLLDAPDKVNEDPYGEGWMIRLRLEDASQMDNLMSPEEYLKYTQEESSPDDA
ncbi:MAG: glycine cleavage system protein GcvH [Acidobacteriota bacterium]